MDDTELIRLFASRSERAISETEQKYGIRCRRFAERILHNPEDWYGFIEVSEVASLRMGDTVYYTVE